MGWTQVNGVYIKDGFYLEPIHPPKMDIDSYALVKPLLLDNFERYRQVPPLLIPLMRGGSRPFLPMSGAFRSVIDNGHIKVDYKSIKARRYETDEIGRGGKIEIDFKDVETAIELLETHSEGILIDDVHDEGISTYEVEKLLAASGKPIRLATLYKKTGRKKVPRNPDYCVDDFPSREIGGIIYPSWIVFPWEVENHEPELWYALFPEFRGLHPKDYLAERLRAVSV